MAKKKKIIGSREHFLGEGGEGRAVGQEWIDGWKRKLPLETITRALQVLVPQVEKICVDRGITDEAEILSFLEHGTLVGLLPVPEAILIRKYSTNPGISVWFSAYVWGLVYVRGFEVWGGSRVRLFRVKRVGE